jgi:anti-anti-sigma regulatory factor
VSISDTGIGIHRSFIEGGVHPAKDAYDAIMLAVQERITSKPKNMGNGLYGLMRVVGLNRGQLEIRSGRGRLRYEDRKATGEVSMSRPMLETTDHHGTTVDWQVDLSRPVSIIEALGMAKDRANLRLEALEDHEGVHRVRVADFEEGLGTRRSAEQVRNRLLNLLNEGAKVLRLDFDDVTVVSSSFADEVLGKLALRLGLMEFMRRFELVGMTATVDAIVERAIQQRLAEGDETTPGTSSAPIRRP